jgi:hypothetical protein
MASGVRHGRRHARIVAFKAVAFLGERYRSRLMRSYLACDHLWGRRPLRGSRAR